MPRKSQPQKTSQSQPRAPAEPATPLAYWFLEVCGDLPVTTITAQLKIKPTHYFTPRRVVPPSFQYVKNMSPHDKYSWWWRTALTSSTLPDDGANLILERFHKKAAVLRSLRDRGTNITIGVNVVLQSAYSTKVYFSRPFLTFTEEAGASVYVMHWNDEPSEHDY